MGKSVFKPGFRLSVIDAVVLILGVGSAGLSFPVSRMVSFILLFVIGHFFQFCNVLRMSRKPELIWTATFLGLSITTLRLGQPGWPSTALLSFLVTVILALLETRKVFYHGIFWQRLNPQLPAWFEKNTGRSELQ